MPRTTLIGSLVLGALAVAGVSIVIWGARRARQDPARCAAGFVALGPRCCPSGQTLVDNACTGRPASCPPGLALGTEGCVALNARARITGGTLRISPSDWEAEGQVEARVLTVGAFELDTSEVTHERWGTCVGRGVCGKADASEPGLPMTKITFDEAERFCRFAGGRLPTGDEWLFAAAGGPGRRYPWGPTGLVCRRAAFGLENGPCATGATGPDLAGARPDGATPEGVLDLAGNVAEWTREPDGSAAARGGSFRSGIAGELHSWSKAALAPTERRPDVGFRCAYDVLP